MTSDYELDMMRQQMATLKNKLDQQEIVNERLIQQSIGSQLRRMRFLKWRKLVIILLGMIYVPGIVFWMLDLPLWFALVTLVFFGIAAVYDFYYMNGISENNMSRQQLLDTSNRLVKMKKMNARWLWFSIPFLIVWLTIFIYLVCMQGSMNEEEMKGFLYGCGGGLVIGAVLGTMVYLRQQRSAQNLIDQIKELEEEK